MTIHSAISIDERKFPTITETGRAMLQFLKEHPNAPVFHNESGNCQTLEDQVYLKEFYSKIVQAPSIDNTGEGWLDTFLEDAIRTVPFYRMYGSPPCRLSDWPAISRKNLSSDITRFVPDTLPADRLINYKTSGATGHPLLIPSHPRVAGSYLAFHMRALKRFGITLKNAAHSVGVVIIGFQRKCFTYVSVTPLCNESGLAKINLHPDDWRHPDDRNKYLEALNAEVISGDPISFIELLRCNPSITPRALFSTSMTLEPSLRKELENRYQCPVLDFYSMNEAGPVAVFDPVLNSHVLLQPQMVVEILDENQHPLPAGIRGEITLTGGFNFCLPLVRYRTGDFASLEWRMGEPVLVNLLGRPPVTFITSNGSTINNVDINHQFEPLGLTQYTLHQQKNSSIIFTGVNIENKRDAIETLLKKIFGKDQLIEIRQVDMFEGKVIQYTREM
jgi:phenylacetate-CoA ligase